MIGLEVIRQKQRRLHSSQEQGAYTGISEILFAEREQSLLFSLEGQIDELLHCVIGLCSRERIFFSVLCDHDTPRRSVSACCRSILNIFFNMLGEFPASETGIELRHIKTKVLSYLRKFDWIKSVIRGGHFVETICIGPEWVVATLIAGAFKSNRFIPCLRMQLVQREITIDPSNSSVFAVFIHDLLHGLVESFAEWTFRIRVLHYFNRRIGITPDMVGCAYRPHLIQIACLLCYCLWLCACNGRRIATKKYRSGDEGSGDND